MTAIAFFYHPQIHTLKLVAWEKQPIIWLPELILPSLATADIITIFKYSWVVQVHSVRLQVSLRFRAVLPLFTVVGECSHWKERILLITIKAVAQASRLYFACFCCHDWEHLKKNRKTKGKYRNTAICHFSFKHNSDFKLMVAFEGQCGNVPSNIVFIMILRLIVWYKEPQSL